MSSSLANLLSFSAAREGCMVALSKIPVRFVRPEGTARTSAHSPGWRTAPLKSFGAGARGRSRAAPRVAPVLDPCRSRPGQASADCLAWTLPVTAWVAVRYAEQGGQVYPVVRQFWCRRGWPRRLLLSARESALVRTPGYRDARTPRGYLLPYCITYAVAALPRKHRQAVKRWHLVRCTVHTIRGDA
ncbi:hypothetical protein D9M70_392750 [compost metagenome]